MNHQFHLVVCVIFSVVGSIQMYAPSGAACAVEPAKDLAAKPKLDMEDPKVFRSHLADLQDKIIEAHAIKNPAARDEAIVVAQKPLNDLRGKIVVFQSATALTNDAPYSVFASGTTIIRGAGDDKMTIRIDAYRNLHNDKHTLRSYDNRSWRPKLTMGREILPEAFKKLTADETVTCWGVVDTWRYENDGRDLKITVEGVLITDPFGKPIVRENKLTTGGRAWRGELLYSDGTSERADFMFLSDNEVDWKSNGDDNHVNDWYGNKPIRGKCVMIGDKVSISLKAKTIDDIEKKAEFKAEFEGVLRNGFLIEGTFKKDRAKIPLIKTPFSNGIPDSDIKNLKIEKDTKGTFRIINSSGD